MWCTGKEDNVNTELEVGAHCPPLWILDSGPQGDMEGIGSSILNIQ